MTSGTTKTWSPQQRSIFGWFAANYQRDRGREIGFSLSRNLIVRARAGSGKTTTIIEAVKQISGDRIVVCAFNKRIQVELQKRLQGSNAEAVTLHALGFKFLRGAWGDLTVDNDVESERLEKACTTLHGETPPWEVMVGLKKLTSVAKGCAPDVVTTVNHDRLVDLCIAFNCEPDWGNYDAVWMAQVVMRAMSSALTPDIQGRISFDDMLFIPAAMGMTIPLYDWVIVDEAQDMNVSQLMVAKGACTANGHIVVVGDDRQAIYGFRGADSGAVDRLKAELNADELGLTTTYRCPKSVVALAQNIVSDFFHADWAEEGDVQHIQIEQIDEHARPGDVILSRTNAPLVPLCLSFIRNGVPARIEGRDIGKLLAARAKKLKATSVDDFRSKLRKWANNATSRALGKVSKRNAALDAKLQQISDIEETLMAMTENAATTDDIYKRCEFMFADIAGDDAGPRTIVLSTVHKAKGLEWKRVFVLDSTFAFDFEKQEEKNILYVALTRTQETLFRVRGRNLDD